MNARHLLGLSLSLALAAFTHADDLPRRASIGVSLNAADEGETVIGLRPGGAAERAGIKIGDIIENINTTHISTAQDVFAALRTLHGGSVANVRILRDSKPLDIAVTLDALIEEKVPGSTIAYSAVTVPDGYKLRTITTTPTASPLAADGKHPAFVFVPGIYCSTIDRPQLVDAPDTRLVHAMAKAGYITLRVDRPGLGDSQGPSCGEINYSTDLAGYKAAIKALASNPAVDPKRIYVFGHSMGGVMMPYLMQDTPIRGAIVFGTVSTTWFEYTLENTRRQLRLSGFGESEITDAMRAETITHAMLLLDKKTMGDVWAKHPELKHENPMVDETHIASRHVSFYHELQDLNIARAWSAVSTNVLAIHGQYDFVSSMEDHERIAKIVNRNAPGFARAIQLPQIDHGLTKQDSLGASLAAMGQGAWDDSFPATIQRWIDEVEGRAKPVSEDDTGS